jgi:transposase
LLWFGRAWPNLSIPTRSGPRKRHVVVDANGVPLAVRLTAANVHDPAVPEGLVDAVPPVRRCRGRPRERPAEPHADKGCDIARCRRALRRRGIEPGIARRDVESPDRLGRHRRVVERTLAWLGQFRRLTVRHERRADIHEAFLTLA